METKTKRIAKVGICVLVIMMVGFVGQHDRVLADTVLVDSTVSVAGCYGFGIPALTYGDQLKWTVETDGLPVDVFIVLWSEWDAAVGCPDVLGIVPIDLSNRVIKTSGIHHVIVTKQLCLVIYNKNIAHVEVSVKITLLEEPAPPPVPPPPETVTVTPPETVTVTPPPIIPPPATPPPETVTVTVTEILGSIHLTFLGLVGGVLVVIRRRN